MHDINYYPCELKKSEFSIALKLALLGYQGQNSRPCRTFKSSLLHDSIETYIQSCKKSGKNPPTRDKPVLEILFNSSADPLNIKSNSKVAVEDLRILLDKLLRLNLTPSLQGYLGTLRESALSFIADFERMGHEKPKIIATNFRYLDQPCVYAYTYKGYWEGRQFSPDAIVPIKVGFAGSNGVERIESQLNESSPEMPVVLFAWPARDEIEARQMECAIHRAILDNDFSRTQGGGKEWFGISRDALYVISDEIGLQPKVVTQLTNF